MENNFKVNINVGDKKLQKCGFVAEVLDILQDNRCIVRFETGIAKEISCNTFSSGKVSAKDNKVRIGDKVRQKNGHVFEVTAIRSDKRIDVVCDNGIIKEDVSKASFRAGTLGVSTPYKLTIGTRVLQNCGSYAEVIELLDGSRCTVRFDSGIIRKNVLRKSFKKGEIRENATHTSHIGRREGHVNYVGMRTTAGNGIGLEIIEYHSFQDIVVKSDDGKVSKTNVVAFKRGYNNLTNNSRSSRANCLGMTRVGLSGTKYTCIEYHGYRDIVLKSENGDIITTYARKFLADKFKDDFNNKNIVGRRILQKCGEYAEIISKNEDGTIDIKFDTGELRYHVSKSAFSNGFIAKKGKLEPVENGANRLGMKYTFIGNVYKGKNSFKCVKFEDGEVATSYRKLFMYPKLLCIGSYFYLKSDKSFRVLSVYFDKIKCKYVALVKNKSGERRMVIL